MLYKLCKHLFIGPVLRAVARPTTDGAENVPVRGPVILAANHHTEIDSLIVALLCPRHVAFLAKAEYFRGRGLRRRALRWFLLSTGQIPVDRAGADVGALDAAVQLLEQGRVWAVYPEGTRSPDGALHRGHTGIARVACRVPEAMIVPVALTGTESINPAGNDCAEGAVTSPSVRRSPQVNYWSATEFERPLMR